MASWIRFVLLTTVIFCGFDLRAAEEITIKGSDTLLQLSQLWAQNYGKKTGVKIQVNGGGSGTGFAALVNDSCDIANASRPIKPSERANILRKFKTRDREYKCGYDGIAVYVHPSNKVKHLTLKQLERIFVGEITDWSEVGGTPGIIVTYGRENSSGTYEFFKEHVLKKKDFAPRVQVLPGTAAIVNAVAKDPKGVGYGGLSYARSVRTLGMKENDSSPAILPTEETVIGRQYPIWRYLYMYTVSSKDQGAVSEFIDWCLKDGQKHVREAGYVPLNR